MKTFFLICRDIFDSPIWRDDSDVLKLFVYLLGKARHQREPKRYTGFELKRGECLTSLSQIAENNEYIANGTVKQWSRGKVSRMLKIMQDRGEIKLLSDTYGTHLSMCNYDTYQGKELYVSDSNGTPTEQGRTSNGHNINKVNNGNNDNKKDIPPKNPKSKYGSLNNVLLTLEEHKKLVEQFGEKGTKERIENLAFYIGSKGAKYKSHYLTILSWEKKNKKPDNKAVPDDGVHKYG